MSRVTGDQFVPVSSSRSADVRSEFDNDPDYRDLLEMFAAALPSRAEALRDAFTAARFGELRVLAHQLKGAGGGFGFPGVTELAGQLEQVCPAGDAEVIRAALDRLLAYLGRIAIA
jgi:HPt (histidine-containing phosphotransfer) domain-containing protein